MADVSKTIEIIFAGTDNLSSSLTSMGKKVDSFGDDLQDIGQPFADATTLVLALDAAIVGLAVAGITASSGIESETAKMTASLGLTNEEAEKFEGIAKEVYTGGFGEDLTEAFNAVTLAQQKLGDNAEVDIGKVTTQALGLQKVFETDINGSLGAVSTLMENFGLTSTEAFDFITAGFQKGLDGSGDFLESVNEYSTQFSNGGADAGEFFSVLESGFSEGMLGTDKAADAFKEFRVRIQDESTTTNEALESLGIDPVAFSASMASGETTAIDAFNIIIGKLNETEDQTVLFNAGVGLMGTQFEDLGTAAALELSTTKTSLSDLSGTMASVADDSETFEKTMSAAFRTVTTEFGSMEQWEDAKDQIGAVFAAVAASVGPAMENADFTGLEGKAGEVWDKIGAIFTENDFDLTTVEGMGNAIELVTDTLESLATVTGGIVEIFAPLIAGAGDLTEWFNSLDESSKTLVGNVLGVGTALVSLGGIVSVSGSLISGLGALVGLISPASLLLVGLAAIPALVYAMRDAFKDYSEISPEEKIKSLADAFDSLDDQDLAIILDVDTASIDDLLPKLDEIPKEIKSEITAALHEGDIDKAKSLLDEVSENQTAEIAVSADTDQASENIDTLFDEVSAFDKNLEIVAKMSPDETSIASTKETLSVIVIDPVTGEKNTITIEVPVSSSGVDQAKKDIETIPTEKMLEIQLQGDIDAQLAEITTSAETVQTAMEWTAKVDIAEAEAASNEIVSAFEASSSAIDSMSTSVSSMFSSLIGGWGDLSMSDQWDFMDLMEDQQDAQNELIAAQVKLTEAQAEYYAQKADSLASGDGQIKIDGTGLSPALEMVMWEILELVQVKATEENADFLLGL